MLSGFGYDDGVSSSVKPKTWNDLVTHHESILATIDSHLTWQDRTQLAQVNKTTNRELQKGFYVEQFDKKDGTKVNTIGSYSNMLKLLNTRAKHKNKINNAKSSVIYAVNDWDKKSETKLGCIGPQGFFPICSPLELVTLFSCIAAGSASGIGLVLAIESSRNLSLILVGLFGGGLQGGIGGSLLGCLVRSYFPNIVDCQNKQLEKLEDKLDTEFNTELKPLIAQEDNETEKEDNQEDEKEKEGPRSLSMGR